MAILTGTSGDDKLIGTLTDDLIIANGGNDTLLGRSGADTYQLYFARSSVGTGPHYKINETWRSDGSVDTITGAGSLVQPTDFANFSRKGDDGQHLVIKTAYKQNSHFVVGIESGTIKIFNQHNTSTPNAQIEKYIAGGVEYNLLNTDTGTAFNDIMTGWRLADTFHAGDGDDYITGGKGNDTLHGEGGNDLIFGGDGRDYIYGGDGADRLFGGGAGDRIFGGEGNDQIEGGAGWDILRGGDGEDKLSGGDQNDKLYGGPGEDTLEGGTGDDRLAGNKGGDVYVISSIGSDSDIIVENGQPPTGTGYFSSGHDKIQVTGYGTLAEAVHGIGIALSGDDLIFSFENALSPGEMVHVTVQDNFFSAKTGIEQVTFANDAQSTVFHISMLSGDKFTYSVHGGADVGGEDIVLGTNGDDEIYGGFGSDLILGGAGADRFMFQDEEDNRGGTDIILDFDLTEDILDFTEIKILERADLTIADNSYGNAVVSSIYGAIELKDISAVQVTDDIFDFFF